MARKQDNSPAPSAAPAAPGSAPDPATLAFKEGVAFEAQGLAAQAEAAYRRAISLSPDAASSCNNLGHLLLKQGRTVEAEIFFRQALRIRPQHLNALINLGGMLTQRQGCAHEAQALLEAALQVDPANFHVWNNLGSAFGAQRLLPQADAAYRKAMALQPGNAAAPSNLGALLASAGRWPEAEQWFRKALALDPQSVQAQVNLCFALLAQGRFGEAWPWHDARYALGNAQAQTRAPDLPMPAWHGEPLAGKSLLIWPEQGYGDYIQFVRYAPLLKAQGLARLTLMCPEVLQALMRTVPGVDEVVSGTVQMARHDYWTFVMSLPQHLGTTLATIPAQLPYLHAPPDRVARWAGRLPAGFKVGLAWKGSPGHRNDASRSLSGVEALAPLWRVPGVQFISLQKSKGATGADPEASPAPPGQPLLALGPQIADFADLAAVIEQLDLVISVDTAVAHLAGALGRPVWVLLPDWGTDWRWLRERTDSPWYPGVMRLFRQRTPDDWGPVVQEVAAALAGQVDPAPNPAPALPAPAVPSPLTVTAAAGSPVRLQLSIRSGRVVPAEEAASARAADACYALASQLVAQQRWSEAEAQLRQAVALAPGHASAFNNLGNLLRQLHRLEEAESAYRQALVADPRHVAALTNLGSLLGLLRRPQEAEPLLRRALEITPDAPQVLDNLGILLDDLRRTAEAEACFRRALEREPRHAGVLSNLGSLLMHEGRLAEAEQLIRQALALTPNMSEAWINLGFLLRGVGRAAEAEAAYRTALASDPGNVLAQLNLALLLLSLGRMREAWPLHRARQSPQRRQNNTRAPEVPWPQWQGEPLQGKSLLVWPEQGLGDGIQFARYARLLKQRGVARLSFACQAALAPLLRTIDGIDDVVVKKSEVKPHDYWVFLMDLPERFDTTLDTIPAALPYVRALPERVAQWRPRLPNAPRVGLVWKGSSGHRNDAHRSLPGLATLAPLWQVAGVQFVSLQKGAGEDEAARPPAGQPLTALGAQFQDFADAAAVVSQLDLVICVDTAVAHLAGALGRPVWVLLPALDPDWRWLKEREDSPWYPGVMGLFRQQSIGGWDETMVRVADALQAFVRPQPPSRPPEAGAAEAEACYRRGIRLADQRQWQAAAAAYREAIALDAGHAGAHHNLGVVLAECGDVPQAIAAYRRALSLAPDHAITLTNLGGLLSDQGQSAEAEPLLRRAVGVRPGYAKAHYQLGRLQARTGRPAEAEASLQQAIALDAALAPAHSDLGALLNQLGRWTEAEASIRAAITLQPEAFGAWINLALLKGYQHRHDEAEAAWREALRLQPGQPQALLGLAFLLLSLGRFSEAWPLHRARHGPSFQRFGTSLPTLAFPRWQGEPLAGKSLVVWPEQGLGDTLQFVRYAALLKAQGLARLTILCKPALAALLETADGVDAVVTNASQVPPHDHWALLLDLPDRLGTTLENLPARLPYLRAPADRRTRWQGRLPAGRRIGLVWRGAAQHDNDANRSLPGLAMLAPLWAAAPEGTHFISLQKGAGEDEALAPPAGQALLALGAELQDFADTAAVVEQLDLVITVDTSVAHLAGALGKPVWVLLPAWGTDWRWLVHRDDSPWYPGVMRLFRQQNGEGGWTETVRRVAAQLGPWLSPAAPAPVPASLPAAEALFLQAAQLAQASAHDQAEAAYLQGLALAPGHVGALNNLGLLLAHRGAVAQAEAVYRQGLAAQPGHPTLLLNLGTLLGDTRRLQEAEGLLQRAAQAQPDDPKPWNNLGRLLARSGRLAEAETAYSRAMALDSGGASSARTNLASLLAHQGRLDEAEALARQALAHKPGAADSWLVLGLVLRHARRDAEAEAALRQALALQPGHATAQLSLCHLLLSQGRFEEGWPLHGARRLRRPGAALALAPDLPYPEWQGGPLQGRSILVWQEQGLGDALQFIRYAALLKAQGAARVTVHCHPVLAALVARVAGVDQVVTRLQDCGPHDHWVMLLDLTRRLGTTLASLPARLPYLQPGPEAVARWRPRLPAGFKVGLVWRGSPEQENDAHRSLPGLAALAPLWQVPGVQFISLQKGAGEAEARLALPAQPLTALGHAFEDFDDTAAVVSQLDLVITVCTSVAHLAGGLGQPTWVLLPALTTDWRWLLDRSDSPWYPGVMRLFRQRKHGDWAPLIDEVRAALARRVAEGP